MPYYTTSLRTFGRLTPSWRASTVGTVTISRVRAAWLFDETSGTSAADSTSNGFSSTSISGTSIVTGKFGNARSFGGSDTINLPTAPTPIPQLSVNDPFSLSFWLNMTTWSTAGNGQVIARFGHASGQIILVTFNSSGTMVMYLAFRGSSQLGFTIPSFAGLVGVWTHFALTFNGGSKSSSSSFTVSMNGSALTFSTNLGAAGGSGTSCALGTNEGNTGGLIGSFDSFLIFDKILSSTEISVLAAARTMGIDSVANTVLVG